MSSPASTSADTPSLAHSWLDDAQGFLLGTVFTALGVAMFKANGQMTGGTAGLAFLLHYTSGLSMGLVFFLANVPFFGLAFWRLGVRFAVKSLVAVALLSGLIQAMPLFATFETIHPMYSAVAGGLLTGMGALAFVRHGASIGGVNILAVYLQQRHRISAGTVQLAVDTLILLGSLFVLDARQLGYSLVGAFCLGAVLTFNHRPGRYMGY